MLKYIRGIEIDNYDEKRKLLNHLERLGFECKFTEHGIAVFAREYDWWERMSNKIVDLIIGISCVVFIIVLIYI